MSLDSIIQATATILGTVPNVGNVYSYRRWAADEATFKKLFTTGSQILVWTITRESTEISDEEESSHDFHAIVIRGWMGTKDEDATERTFQSLVESVRSAFQTNRTLFDGTSYNAEFSDRVRARKVDYVKYGEYLCHYAELELKVTDVVAG
jgi:hypothetical protein